MISLRFLSKRETSPLDTPKEKKNLLLERESQRGSSGAVTKLSSGDVMKTKGSL
jgi:hypothetical protein